MTKLTSFLRRKTFLKDYQCRHYLGCNGPMADHLLQIYIWDHFRILIDFTEKNLILHCNMYCMIIFLSVYESIPQVDIVYSSLKNLLTSFVPKNFIFSFVRTTEAFFKQNWQYLYLTFRKNKTLESVVVILGSMINFMWKCVVLLHAAYYMIYIIGWDLNFVFILCFHSMLNIAVKVFFTDLANFRFSSDARPCNHSRLKNGLL